MSRPPQHSRVTVEFRLEAIDLYWMYQTSGIGLGVSILFVALGLVFLAPTGAPETPNWAAGIGSLLLAFTLAPVVMGGASGTLFRRGACSLTFDARGVSGWPVPESRATSWHELKNPRLESRVLILPFSWPWADAWVVVPARAFTPAQFDAVLQILNSNGFLAEQDRRSPMGSVLSAVADLSPKPRTWAASSRLRAYPSFPERLAGHPLSVRKRLSHRLLRRHLVGKWILACGVVELALTIVSTPQAAPKSDIHTSGVLGGFGFALVALGGSIQASRWRRLPVLWRRGLTVALLLLAFLAAATAALHVVHN